MSGNTIRGNIRNEWIHKKLEVVPVEDKDERELVRCFGQV